MFSVNRSFVLAVCLIVVSVVVAQMLALGGGAYAGPPRQGGDLPEPQLCTQEEPVLTPIAELGPEFVDDQTVLVFYTNDLGQSFDITLTSENADLLSSYVDTVLICYEAVEVDLEALAGLASDIAFGDIFLSTLSNYVELEELMALRLENPELTLRGVLAEQGVAEEFLAVALESAYAQIETAVSEERLRPEVAEELRGQVELMYTEALDVPAMPIIPLAKDPKQELSIEVTLRDGAGINEESYFIFAAVDPFLSSGQCTNHTLPLKYASVYLRVTQGAVSGTVYHADRYQWYLYAVRGQTVKSPYVWANRVRACGWQASNTYYVWN